MKDWIAKKFRAGRLSMNLQLLEVDILRSTSQQIAEIIVAAGVMMEKLRRDDFVTGTRLNKAATEAMSTSPEEALFFYNSLEDILNATETHRKQVVRHLTDHSGAAAAQEVNAHAALQQNGLRLLMVALARNIDADFKPKARALREKLFEARSEIPAAVQSLQMRENLMKGLGGQHGAQDFESIQTSAEQFAFTFFGW